MGKIFNRYLETGKRGVVDARYAFEVSANGITTHDIEGVFIKKLSPKHTHPLTNESKVKLGLDFDAGSGSCKVTTGSDTIDYHVYGRVEEFAQEVQNQIDNLPK